MLQISELKFNYKQNDGKEIRALRGIDFSLTNGESAALVGESGCGKTTLCNIVNLILKDYGGSVLFDGKELKNIDKTKDYYSKVQYIFQDSKSAVSPYQKLAYFMTAPLINLKGMNKTQALNLVREKLPAIGLLPEILNKRPNEVSLGQLQRLCLLKSLLIGPKVLLCDEITASLDEHSIKDCLKIINEYQKTGMSVLFITHDIELAKSFSNRIIVMFKGTILEDTQGGQALTHPYAQELLNAAAALKRSQLNEFSPKSAPSCPITVDSICPYYKRCNDKTADCLNEFPKLFKLSENHCVRCLKFKNAEI